VNSRQADTLRGLEPKLNIVRLSGVVVSATRQDVVAAGLSKVLPDHVMCRVCNNSS